MCVLYRHDSTLNENKFLQWTCRKSMMRHKRRKFRVFSVQQAPAQKSQPLGLYPEVLQGGGDEGGGVWLQNQRSATVLQSKDAPTRAYILESSTNFKIHRKSRNSRCCLSKSFTKILMRHGKKCKYHRVVSQSV